MARSDPNERIDRLFRHPSGQDELFDKSCEEVLDARRGEPVECLGLTFENDEAQRSHYAPYHRKPFAVDVSEGKAHPRLPGTWLSHQGAAAWSEAGFSARPASDAPARPETDALTRSETGARIAELRAEVDRAFLAWIERRYAGLHNQPPDPPVMVHHVPRHLARRIEDGSEDKVALVVVDGLALDQWIVLRDVLAEQRPRLRFREGAVFAWVPTITSVSRQAIFAGKPPFYFPLRSSGTVALPSKRSSSPGFGSSGRRREHAAPGPGRLQPAHPPRVAGVHREPGARRESARGDRRRAR